MEMLNVLDDAGKVIGQASRSEIHEKGLPHAEVHVWFYTSRGTILFQHRAKDKDTYPDRLDATVGGHVQIGDTYEESAIRETEEETGVQVTSADLIPIDMAVNKTFDDVTKMTNNFRRQIYAYLYMGEVSELKVEIGKSLGFEEWPIEKMFSLTESERERFIPSDVSASGLEIMKKIQSLYLRSHSKEAVV